MIVLCCAIACPAEEKKKPEGNGVLIEVKLTSEVDGNIIKMAPKVMTMDGKVAKIFVGDSKAQLNNKDVKSDKTADAGKNFATTIELTPKIISGASPELIKLDLKFNLNHNGCEITESFSTVISGKEPFIWEYVDPKRKQKVGLYVNASVSQEKSGKVKVDVETK